jgi:hypothetical protein
VKIIKNPLFWSGTKNQVSSALTDGTMDVHTLSKQMGTSVGMIEKHYSKLTATMAADRLA